MRCLGFLQFALAQHLFLDPSMELVRHYFSCIALLQEACSNLGLISSIHNNDLRDVDTSIERLPGAGDGLDYQDIGSKSGDPGPMNPLLSQRPSDGAITLRSLRLHARAGDVLVYRSVDLEG
jgi:hypothetical protein